MPEKPVLTEEEIKLTEELFPGTEELIRDTEFLKWQDEVYRILLLSYQYWDYENIIEIAERCAKLAVANWHHYLFTILVEDWQNPSKDDLALFHSTYKRTIRPMVSWWKAYINYIRNVPPELQPAYSSVFAIDFEGLEGIGLAGMLNWLTNKYVLLYPNLKEYLKREDFDFPELDEFDKVFPDKMSEIFRSKDSIKSFAKSLIEGNENEFVLTGKVTPQDLEKEEWDTSTLSWFLKNHYENMGLTPMTLQELVAAEQPKVSAVQRWINGEFEETIKTWRGSARELRFEKFIVAKIEESIKDFINRPPGLYKREMDPVVAEFLINVGLMLIPIEAVIGAIINIAKPIYNVIRNAVFTKVNASLLRAGVGATRVAFTPFRSAFRRGLAAEAGRIMFPVLRKKIPTEIKPAIKPKDFFSHAELAAKNLSQAHAFFKSEPALAVPFVDGAFETISNLRKLLARGKIKVSQLEQQTIFDMLHANWRFKSEVLEVFSGSFTQEELLQPFKKLFAKAIVNAKPSQIATVRNMLADLHKYYKDTFFAHLLIKYPQIAKSPLPLIKFYKNFEKLGSPGAWWSYQVILNQLGIRSRASIILSTVSNLFKKSPLLMLTAVQGCIFAAFIYEEDIQAQSFLTFYAKTLGRYMTPEQERAALKAVTNIAKKADRYKFAFIPYVGPIIALTEYFNAIRDTLPFLRDYINQLAKEAQEERQKQNVAKVFTELTEMSKLNATEGHTLDPTIPDLTDKFLTEFQEKLIAGEIENKLLKMLFNGLKGDLFTRIQIIDKYLPEADKFSLQAIKNNIEISFRKRNIIKNAKLYDAIRTLLDKTKDMPDNIRNYLFEKSAFETLAEKITE